jgi:hypothetical protein
MSPEMTWASPEQARQIELSYSQIEPERIFKKCKIDETQNGMFVRIYFLHREYQLLIPTPYAIYRFNPTTGVLSRTSREEAAPYLIKNYK